MSLYRDNLPQCGDALFVTDGGIEMVMIFEEGIELPEFAAFVMLKDEAGREALRKYVRPYAKIARDNGAGLLLDTVTWRANPDWGEKLGYSAAELEQANRAAVNLYLEIREEFAAEGVPIVVGGCIGPRGDGYVVGQTMTAEEAESYHDMQARVFAESDADMINAITMTYGEEATGIALAAKKHGMPVAISFTVETDGKLPCGVELKDAIEQVDAATGAYPAYYMVNCAHPTHFDSVVASRDSWIDRLGGIRPNASCMSHEELDAAEELDSGDPAELAGQCAELRAKIPSLHVMGGCCGTNHVHIEAITKACLSA